MDADEKNLIQDVLRAHVGPIRDDMRELRALTADALKIATRAVTTVELTQRQIDSTLGRVATDWSERFRKDSERHARAEAQAIADREAAQKALAEHKMAAQIALAEERKTTQGEFRSLERRQYYIMGAAGAALALLEFVHWAIAKAGTP